MRKLSVGICRFRVRHVVCVLLAMVIVSLAMSLLISNTDEFSIYENLSQVSVNKRSKGRFPSQMNTSQACNIPQLPLWSPAIEDYFALEFEPTYECDDEYEEPWVNTVEEPWVYTAHGKIYISSRPVRDYGEITCEYANMILGSPVYFKIINGSDVAFDAFHVVCKATHSNKAYRRNHVSASLRKSINATHYSRREDVPFNVLWYGFDSLSRHMFQRMLPRTHDYFTRILNGTILEGYNIVGDATANAFIPMLTGYYPTEIPEGHLSHPNRKYLDKIATFLWERYERKGYVTQWGEDMIEEGGLFNRRHTGFSVQPVTHSMHAFQLALAKGWPAGDLSRNCVGSKTKHAVFVDWLMEVLTTYTAQNKSLFSTGFFSQLSHGNTWSVPNLEDTNIKFLESLHNQGLLDNTILILMSDHGGRFGKLRVHEQGKLEERMPYFGVRLPPKFKKLFPHKAEMLSMNTKRLTTPFDIHETLLDLIGESNTQTGHKLARGISLFKEVPKDRTCQDAGIEPHWCICMVRTPIPLSDPQGVNAVKHSVLTLNKMIHQYLDICHEITLQEIIKMVVLETDESVLKFKGTMNDDHIRPNLTDDMTKSSKLFQTTFMTSPGNAIFETTVLLDIKQGGMYLNNEDVSRINKYGNAPHCIVEKSPNLQPYCYCREPGSR